MPVEIGQVIEAPIPPTSTAVYPPRKRWTRAECNSLEATGLWDRERLELIEGELITKMSKKRPHMIAFTLILKWLTGAFGVDYLNLEGPLDVAPEDNPTSEPEPDIAVLTKVATEYMKASPGASDVRLLIEVSDSTLAFDLGPKARLYARAGIADYWVLDVVNRRILVHRKPEAGRYTTVTAYAPGEAVAPLASLSQVFSVDTAFPPLSRT